MFEWEMNLEKRKNELVGKKEGEKSHRPLQPPTLAAFPPWGNSEGASHMTLTGCKINSLLVKSKELKEEN